MDGGGGVDPGVHRHQLRLRLLLVGAKGGDGDLAVAAQLPRHSVWPRQGPGLVLRPRAALPPSPGRPPPRRRRRSTLVAYGAQWLLVTHRVSLSYFPVSTSVVAISFSFVSVQFFLFQWLQQRARSRLAARPRRLGRLTASSRSDRTPVWSPDCKLTVGSDRSQLASQFDRVTVSLQKIEPSTAPKFNFIKYRKKINYVTANSSLWNIAP